MSYISALLGEPVCPRAQLRRADQSIWRTRPPSPCSWDIRICRIECFACTHAHALARMCLLTVLVAPLIWRAHSLGRTGTD